MKSFAAIFIILLVCVSAIAGDNKWTSNGPYGGSFGYFCFHPRINNLIFASSYDGAFRSENGGKSWKRLPLLPGVTPIIRIHPLNPTTIVVAGERIYSSSDRGNSWQEISGGVSDSFSDLEFHPANPLILYGATNSHGIYKSTDGGKTWTQKSFGLDLKSIGFQNWPQIEVGPDGSTAYVLLQSHKVYKTTNGGESWQAINQGLQMNDVPSVFSLVLDPGNPEVLYLGTWARIYKTTNAGVQWFAVFEMPAMNIAIDSVSPQTLYSAGFGESYKSTNGGTTWTRLFRGGTWGVAVHPKKSNLVFIGGYGSQGIFRSQNAGKTWQLVNSGLDAQRMGRIAAHSEQDRMFAVNGTVLFESRDGGSTWDVGSLSSTSFAFDVRIHPRNPDFVAVAGDGIAISRDGGETWDSGAEYFFSNLLALDPGDQKIIYLAPTEWPRGALGIARSSDGGETWRLTNKGLSDKEVSAITVDPRSGSNVLAGTSGGKIFKSTNGGKVWKSSGGYSHSVWSTAIAFDPTNSSVVYAAARGGGLLKSTNGGNSWATKSNYSGDFFVAVDPTNPRTIFTGGFGAVFVSADSGETWSAFDSFGLGPVFVNDFLIDPNNRDKFLIGTSRGVFSYTRKGAAGGPVIEQLSPGAGKVGDAVTINGRAFSQIQGTSKVLFGNIDVGIAQSWSDTSIKTIVPNGARTGPVTVTVFNRKSNPYEFIILPASGNIEPTSGSSGGGTRVTILAPSGISGTQFNVLFGSNLARNIGFAEPNIITCDSPPGTGTVEVSVTSSAVVAKVGNFTYQ